jgi:peroxiredoxin
MVSTKDYKDAVGMIVVFTCNHCPFAKLYTDRLNALHRQYSNQHIPLIAINSSDTLMFESETYAHIKTYAQEHHYLFPYLCDAGQTVAKNFKAEKTPHAFVLWREGGKWVIKYNGAIDDNGAEPTQVKHAYITEALQALLGGKPVANPVGYSIGCAIHYRK